MTSFPADDVYHLDWSSVAFSQTAKKSLKELQATFIAAPREMSAERFKQLVKQYLPLGPIMLGLSKDPFVAGFEGQPQFKTLSFEAVRGIVDKVNASRTPHRIYTLAYFQREAKFVFGELLRVICDAIIMNEKREVLFQERPEDAQLEHNYLTLPGGGVEDFTTTLEVELAREVKEETGLDITSQPLKLVASRIAGHAYKRLSPHLNVRYNEPVTCLWNMYYLEQVPDLAGLTPGDDCSGFVWIPFKEAATHPRLSPEMRETFKGLKL